MITCEVAVIKFDAAVANLETAVTRPGRAGARDGGRP